MTQDILTNGSACHVPCSECGAKVGEVCRPACSSYDQIVFVGDSYYEDPYAGTYEEYDYPEMSDAEAEAEDATWD